MRRGDTTLGSLVGLAGRYHTPHCCNVIGEVILTSLCMYVNLPADFISSMAFVAGYNGDGRLEAEDDGVFCPEGRQAAYVDGGLANSNG